MCAWQRKRDFSKGRPTPSEALRKLERYCAYQDRCHQEVRRKLYDIGMYGDDVDQVMATLIETRFLDEERFARSFARGKFKIKRWGRVRIERELKQRQIGRYCVRAGLSELDELDYRGALAELLRKRYERQAGDLHPYARRQDLIQHALRKGYETALAVEVARELADAPRAKRRAG